MRLQGYCIVEVVAIRAIPKKLLIHTVTMSRTAEEDRWGNETPGAAKKIRYVRMEPTTKVIRDKNSAEIQLAATLFYDCRNSRPQGVVFAVDDIITFNGQKHQVKLVEPLYDGQKLHHYEMGLIKRA